MKAKQLIDGEIHLISPDDSVARIRNLLIKHNISRVMVYKEKPLGIITEKDLSNAFFKERRGIDTIKAREIMSKKMITIASDASIEQAADKMIKSAISGLPVEENGKIIGEITKNGLSKHYSENHRGETKVSEIMTEKIETASEYHTIFHAAKKMKSRKIKRIVVVKDKKAVGIVSERDISMAQARVKPTKMTFIRKTSRGTDRKTIKTMPLIIGDVMNHNLETVDFDTDSAKAARTMIEKDIGSLVVIKNGKPVGIITKTDIVKCMAEKGNKQGF